ncbi:MAG TPA: pyridoxamine 5'-phosphate oxidase family protein [Rhodocyclaceae bacterium]|nr:pyridoxamine 5'-phosphate oxidase family protein [Rhodocyclaceae bacterium]
MKLPLEPVLHLIHAAPHATLATHSAQLPGYPYATTVPNVLDQHHRPLLLVSALAEHTKNLLADSRVSLALVDAAASEVQAAARLSLTGDAEPFTPDAQLLARYLRFEPAAEQYLQLDFTFFRIVPKRIRYIAGVGRMGWIEAPAWGELDALEPRAEADWLARAAEHRPAGIELLGIDRYGVDYRRDTRRQRLDFAAAPLADADLALQLAQLAQLLKH